MDEGREKAREIWKLLTKISFEMEQIRKGHGDIEALKKWMKETDIYVTFSAGGRRGGEFCPNLYTSDFDEIVEASIEVICKRLEQRNAEALECVKKIQEILTEVEEEANE